MVQESYLKLLRARAKGRVSSARAYVFAIARNTALSLFRRSKFICDVPVNELPDWRVVEDRPDAAAMTNARQQFALAEEAIDHLPARCRAIVRMAAFSHVPVPEIAARMGIAPATVYVQMARGLRKCADYLRERGELP